MGGPDEFERLVWRYQLALDRFNQADSDHFDQVNQELSQTLYALNQYIIQCKRQLGFPVHSTTHPQVARVS
ncbi:hypothetical protein [Sulfobacillus thermosulfidooxidans]|uniref:hypothetical protein n=1 Tax=Sulfobacillus thermosulfidooxidans TaxID=28034 RepID=UPI00042A13B9|nr:hypothetical protein [Sulfobacillus thermosulfidooxidans]